MGLLLLSCWDCGFESRRGYGCVSFVVVVCCKVEVSALGWSLIQRNPTECDIVKPQQWGSPGPRGTVAPWWKKERMLHVAGARLKVYCSYYCPPSTYIYMCIGLSVSLSLCIYMYVEGYTNRGRQFAVVTAFCSLAPHVCGTSVWNLFPVSLLAPKILK